MSWYARGIPVITTNTDIKNSARLAYVGCDFYRSGQTAAGLMHLIGKPPVRTGIITGSSRVLCHSDRIAGFQDRIRSHYPDIRILDTRENSDDEFESYANTLAMLRDHPDLNATRDLVWRLPRHPGLRPQGSHRHLL